MRKKISFAGPWITERETSYVKEAAAEGWYGNYDKYMKEFEDEVKNYLGVKYAIGTHCCTQALHLAAVAIGLKEGDEVIVTDHSWVATAHSIAYTGAKCVFVDIIPETLCINPEEIRKAITPKTKAIMVVHNFGIPADMDEITSIAKEYNLKVIEDAAPALGSIYKDKKCGTIGDVGCISFQGAKIAVASEGGVLVTNNEEIYKKACLFASMGRTDSQANFWSDEMGYQYTIGSLPAAMATVQIRRINELVDNKRKIYGWYARRLEQSSKIQMVKEKEGTFANYTYPACFLTDEVEVSAQYVENKLRDYNIFCRTGFPQMSRFPMYEKRFETPVSQHFYEKGIVLPAAHNLVEEDIEFVCETLLKLVS
ncbi:MAG: DegT/DnrJ/EryC1/StrS family aminotransferase [Lachnospiraceae bacterium]